MSVNKLKFELEREEKIAMEEQKKKEEQDYINYQQEQLEKE